MEEQKFRYFYILVQEKCPMLTTDERFERLIEKINLLEKHITSRWIESKRSPDVQEMKILQEELRSAVTELQDLHRTIKVFKTL